MHPILFTIPGIPWLKIHTYGVMAALGFVAALLWIRYRSKYEGLPVAKMYDLAFLMIVSAIAGSRLLYVIRNWEFFSSDLLAVFKIWEGGLVFQGGLILCVLVAWRFTRKHQFSFWKIADTFMPGVAIGHALGRLGCLAAGCCYGRPCDPHAWYGLVFPPGLTGLAPGGIPLYPTQLMESLGEGLLFAVLAAQSHKKAFDGQILLLYLILYSLLRIGIEFFRGDIARLHGWTGAQLIALGIFVLACAALIYRRGSSS